MGRPLGVLTWGIPCQLALRPQSAAGGFGMGSPMSIGNGLQRGFGMGNPMSTGQQDQDPSFWRPICYIHYMYSIFIYTISYLKKLPPVSNTPCDETLRQTLRRDLATSLRRALRRRPCDEGYVCGENLATDLATETLRRPYHVPNGRSM